MSTTTRTALPPSAFILYRAHKLRTLPAPPPGTARTESEVLQIIHRMWLHEPSHVRAHFEEQAAIHNDRGYIAQQSPNKHGYSGNLSRLETANPPAYRHETHRRVQ